MVGLVDVEVVRVEVLAGLEAEPGPHVLVVGAMTKTDPAIPSRRVVTHTPASTRLPNR
jgi:hypothetical protein